MTDTLKILQKGRNEFKKPLTLHNVCPNIHPPEAKLIMETGRSKKQIIKSNRLRLITKKSERFLRRWEARTMVATTATFATTARKMTKVIMDKETIVSTPRGVGVAGWALDWTFGVVLAGVVENPKGSKGRPLLFFDIFGDWLYPFYSGNHYPRMQCWIINRLRFSGILLFHYHPLWSVTVFPQCTCLSIVQ